LDACPIISFDEDALEVSVMLDVKYEVDARSTLDVYVTIDAAYNGCPLYAGMDVNIL
jgi:hypothetical protein